MSEAIEAAAFAIYSTFIRGAHGTQKPVFNEKGERIGIETPEQACERRWRDMPELQRQRFRDEAIAALSAA